MRFLAVTNVGMEKVGEQVRAKTNALFINPDAVIAVDQIIDHANDCVVYLNTGASFRIAQSAVSFIRMINFPNQGKPVKVDVDPTAFSRTVYRPRRSQRPPVDPDLNHDPVPPYWHGFSGPEEPTDYFNE